MSPIDRREYLKYTGVLAGTPAAYSAAVRARDEEKGEHEEGKDVRISKFTENLHTDLSIGKFEQVYDPSSGRSQNWYINDHSFIQDSDSTWHLFGITHSEPYVGAGEEDQLAHATAPTLHGPWTRQPPVLRTDPSRGETHLWAPHVIHHDGTYYMFYAGGGADPSQHQINLATSDDLRDWERYSNNPLFRDGHHTRDPYVLKVDGEWVMYYTANRDPDRVGSDRLVTYRTSTDLHSWSERRVAFSRGNTPGLAESPFVVTRPGGRYYLFVGWHRSYTGTDVYVSRNPFNWERSQHVAHLPTHAPEVIHDGHNPHDNKRWFISSCGWGNRGVAIAPLKWGRPEHAEGLRVVAPGYRVTLWNNPWAELRSLEMLIDGEYREVTPTPNRNMRPTNRGIRPYLAVDQSWGLRQVPRIAEEMGVSGSRVTLRSVPMGYQPITFDWSFDFQSTWFDTSLSWNVSKETSTTVRAQAMNFSLNYPQVGDDEDLTRWGDVRGFPKWVLATDDDSSFVIAYKENSAWREDNHWFGNFQTTAEVPWQSLWNPQGEYIQPGNYPGGTWRIGASDTGVDTEFANQLYNELNS